MRKWAKKTRWPNRGGVNDKDSFDIINNLVLEEPQVHEIVENDEISIKLCHE